MPKDIENKNLVSSQRFRLATIEPQSARIDIVISKLDSEYYRHLQHLRRMVQNLHKRKDRLK